MDSGLIVIAAKLEERARFERAGARLYEALMEKAADPGLKDPTHDQLEEFRDQELAHVALVEEILRELGKEPDPIGSPIDIASAALEALLQEVDEDRTDLNH